MAGERLGGEEENDPADPADSSENKGGGLCYNHYAKFVLVYGLLCVLGVMWVDFQRYLDFTDRRIYVQAIGITSKNYNAWKLRYADAFGDLDPFQRTPTPAQFQDLSSHAEIVWLNPKWYNGTNGSYMQIRSIANPPRVNMPFKYIRDTDAGHMGAYEKYSDDAMGIGTSERRQPYTFSPGHNEWVPVPFILTENNYACWDNKCKDNIAYNQFQIALALVYMDEQQKATDIPFNHPGGTIIGSTKDIFVWMIIVKVFFLLWLEKMKYAESGELAMMFGEHMFTPKCDNKQYWAWFCLSVPLPYLMSSWTYPLQVWLNNDASLYMPDMSILGISYSWWIWFYVAFFNHAYVVMVIIMSIWNILEFYCCFDRAKNKEVDRTSTCYTRTKWVCEKVTGMFFIFFWLGTIGLGGIAIWGSYFSVMAYPYLARILGDCTFGLYSDFFCGDLDAKVAQKASGFKRKDVLKEGDKNFPKVPMIYNPQKKPKIKDHRSMEARDSFAPALPDSSMHRATTQEFLDDIHFTDNDLNDAGHGDAVPISTPAHSQTPTIRSSSSSRSGTSRSRQNRSMRTAFSE